MFSGFIFDVEGTLVDSVTQNLKSQQEALERFGHQVPYSTLQLYSGLDGDQTLQLVLPEAEEPERKKILKAKGDIYEAKYLDEVRPFDGVRDVFRALVERGGKIALATDCKDLSSNAIFPYCKLTNSSARPHAATMWSTVSPIHAWSA